MPPITKVPRTDEFFKVRNRELELRRLSGEISCSECRRMKLKCDKKIPCCHCVRRGYQEFCPIGRPVNGDSTRLKVADTTSENESLRRQIEAMSERIRILEDALHVETSAKRSEPHPLLSDTLLSIKKGKWVEPVEHAEQDEEISRAFGTMAISEGKNIRYLGASATENQLLLGLLGSNSEGNEEPLSDEIIQASDLWPFVTCSKEALLAQLVAQLPPFDRATGLIEAFICNLAWFTSTVHRDQILDELVPLFYPNRRPLSPLLANKSHIHELALFFSILACGAVADLTLPPINAEGERFNKVARAAMGVQDILKEATIPGVQTIFLLGSYGLFCGHKSSQEESWKMYSVGLSLAASIGLHRDPSRWKFDPIMTDRRRRIFWEIYMLDQWKSMQTGRPPSFMRNMIDCEFPEDKLATVKEDGTIQESVRNWRFRFTRDVLPLITETFCSVHPLKYKDILDLDRKIRDFDVYPDTYYIKKKCPIIGDELYSTFRILYPFITVLEKEEALMHINRNYFAHAILNFPNDPTKSPYAASFLATFRSSCYVLKICYEHYDKIALVMSRVWPLWGLMLVSAVVIGSVASLGSTIGYATTAFKELENAISVFKKSQHTVAKHALPLLFRLRERAIKALSQPPSKKSSHRSPNTNGEEKVDEELLILRGTTRIHEYRKSGPLNVSRVPPRELTYESSPSPSISNSSIVNVVDTHATTAHPVSAAFASAETSYTQTNSNQGSHDNSPSGFLDLLNKQNFPDVNEQHNELVLLELLGQPQKQSQSEELNPFYYAMDGNMHWNHEYSKATVLSMNVQSEVSQNVAPTQASTNNGFPPFYDDRSLSFGQQPHGPTVETPLSSNVAPNDIPSSISRSSEILDATISSIVDTALVGSHFDINSSPPVIGPTYPEDNINLGNDVGMDFSFGTDNVVGSKIPGNMIDVDPSAWSRFIAASGLDFSGIVNEDKEDNSFKPWMNWAT